MDKQNDVSKVGCKREKARRRSRRLSFNPPIVKDATTAGTAGTDYLRGFNLWFNYFDGKRNLNQAALLLAAAS